MFPTRVHTRYKEEYFRLSVIQSWIRVAHLKARIMQSCRPFPGGAREKTGGIIGRWVFQSLSTTFSFHFQTVRSPHECKLFLKSRLQRCCRAVVALGPNASQLSRKKSCKIWAGNLYREEARSKLKYLKAICLLSDHIWNLIPAENIHIIIKPHLLHCHHHLCMKDCGKWERGSFPVSQLLIPTPSKSSGPPIWSGIAVLLPLYWSIASPRLACHDN